MLPQQPQFQVTDNPSLVGGGKQIAVSGQALGYDNKGQITVSNTTIRLIPYYAWNHRGAGKMQVWIANKLKGLDD